MGFVVDKSVPGAGLLRVLRFPLPIVPPTAPHSSSISWGWYNRTVVASVIVDSVALHPQKGGGRGMVQTLSNVDEHVYVVKETED
jgi:hypothetical protein